LIKHSKEVLRFQIEIELKLARLDDVSKYQSMLAFQIVVFKLVRKISAISNQEKQPNKSKPSSFKFVQLIFLTDSKSSRTTAQQQLKLFFKRSSKDHKKINYLKCFCFYQEIANVNCPTCCLCLFSTNLLFAGTFGKL
jgi:hypothetical protein